MLVRHELGPDDIRDSDARDQRASSLVGWGNLKIEVQASRDAKVMRRFADGAGGPKTHSVSVGRQWRSDAPKNCGPLSVDDRFDMTEEDTDGPDSCLNYGASENDSSAPDDAQYIHRR